jgi:hypothetical protein
MIFTKEQIYYSCYYWLVLVNKRIHRSKAVLKKPIETALIIQQGQNLRLPILSQKNSILHYYNKTWPRESANGGFLVAKNEIIYENMKAWQIIKSRQ